MCVVVGAGDIGSQLLELAAADEAGVLPDEVRVVAIERGRSVLLPQGNTEIRTGDLVTVFSKRGFDSGIIDVFVGEEPSASTVE